VGQIHDAKLEPPPCELLLAACPVSPASTFPYSYDLTLRRGEAAAVTCPEDDPFVRGNPEEISCGGEGKQQPRISGIGGRGKRPVG
jgi:hypothetical protein